VLLAKTVQVMYDYKAERPVPIPEEIRQLLKIHATAEQA
jgi:acyl-CoA thioesterase FadM